MATTDSQNARPGQQSHGAQEDSNIEREIDLLELFYRLLERFKYIVAAALVGALIAAFYSFVMVTPMYEATAKLYVLSSGDSAINLADLQIGTYLASDYPEVFSTWEVHEMVARNLGLNYSNKQMQGMLSISNPTDTRILYITVTNRSPSVAAAIANEYATVAKKFIYEKMSTEEPNIMSRALEPTYPSSPNKTRNIMLGFILGAILACGVFVVQFMMDDRLRTSEDIERYLGMPTLAIVSEQSKRAVAKANRAPKVNRVPQKGSSS